MQSTYNYARHLSRALLAGCCFGIAGLASAEQVTDQGALPLAAGARLDFRVEVPRFLLFRVGSPAATIDQIDFQPTAEQMAAVAEGTPTTVNATVASGDAGTGKVTVRLVANGGAVTITPSNDGGGNGLSNAGGTAFIPYSDIKTTETGGGGIAPPTLSNAGGTASSPATTGGGGLVTARTSQWEFTYEPVALPADGVYTGRVTYTAGIP